VLTAATGNATRPDVDGDGRNWIVAFETEPAAGSGNTEIAAVGIGWTPVAVVSNQGYLSTNEVIVSALAGNESLPHCLCTGHAVLVCYTHAYSATDLDVRGRLVDLYTCAECEGAPIAFAITSDSEREIAVGRGSSSNVQSLAVWTHRDLTSPPVGATSDIRGRLYHAQDGADGIPRLFGGPVPGCGAGGAIGFSCLRVGNANFAFRLLGAAPASAAYLLFSHQLLSPFGHVCGTCTIAPDPWTGFAVLAGTTDGRGNASLASPIPNSIAMMGHGAYIQWAVPGTGCMGLDFSNAVTAIIE
jgi:hypothetical protein